MTEFYIDYKVTAKDSTNKFYAGVHWSERKQYVDMMHLIVTSALIKQRIPKKPYSKPVRISFWWTGKLDLDNYGFIRKTIIDALKGWVIVDDDGRYVRGLQEQYSTTPLITVRVEELI